MTKQKLLPLSILFAMLLLISGCADALDTSAERVTADTPVPDPTIEIVSTAAINGDLPISEPELPSETETETEDDDGASIETTQEEEITEAPPISDPITDLVFPDPLSPRPDLAQVSVTDNEQRTSDALYTDVPQSRNDTNLAIAYKGLDPNFVPEPLPVAERQIGDIETFTIHNVDSNTDVEVQAELMGISDHAYFWFDLTEGNNTPTADTLTTAGASFDQTYDIVTGAFGSDKPEGAFDIDGESRVHVFNASPVTICNPGRCGLLGYYSGKDALPKAVNSVSNEKDMFVMNGSTFPSPRYLTVLGHEFRHMVEFAYDQNDWDWAVEGSAMLAEDLMGSPQDGIGRANGYLRNPDQQLNRWTDSNPTPYYGQGYLLSRYIYNRLGADLYKVYATDSRQGFEAVTAVAEENGLGFDGQQVWLDWLVAQAIHNAPNAGEKYALPQGTTNPFSTALTKGNTEETTVSQYAADYYVINNSEGNVTLTFTGSTHTPLMRVLPRSGSQMWVANRTNQSQAQLTRTFDLRTVDSATLFYSVYRDIELGYDFAYTSVSIDGGVTWQGLRGINMDGIDPVDDPSNDALTDRFYTGQARDPQWFDEEIDLTEFVGNVIQVRFEYVTDPILTFEGIAIDNIAIPEIGFADDVEGNSDGWEASGFVQATGYLPQIWQVQLVTFLDGSPVVTSLELDELNTAAVELDVSQFDSQLFVIVSASSPMTLRPAHYRLSVE